MAKTEYITQDPVPSTVSGGKLLFNLLQEVLTLLELILICVEFVDDPYEYRV
jgi:hypothetical protein